MDSSPRKRSSTLSDRQRQAGQKARKKRKTTNGGVPVASKIDIKVRASDVDAIDKMGKIVENIGQFHIFKNACTQQEMFKIGVAVVEHGRNSKEVIALEEKGILPGKRAAREFLANIHRVYVESLEKYQRLAGLETCCVCLGAIDDTVIREMGDDAAAAARFTNFSQLPHNPNPDGTEAYACRCKNKTICLSCYLKLIQVSPNLGCVRVRCPTCRRLHDFDVGTMADPFGERVVTVDRHAIAGERLTTLVPFSIYSPPPPLPHPQQQQQQPASSSELIDAIRDSSRDEDLARYEELMFRGIAAQIESDQQSGDRISAPSQQQQQVHLPAPAVIIRQRMRQRRLDQQRLSRVRRRRTQQNDDDSTSASSQPRQAEASAVYDFPDAAAADRDALDRIFQEEEEHDDDYSDSDSEDEEEEEVASGISLSDREIIDASDEQMVLQAALRERPMS